MTPAAWTAFTVAGVAAVVKWFAVARGQQRLEYVAKPLTMATLALAALTLDPADPTRRQWFVAAAVAVVVTGRPLVRALRQRHPELLAPVVVMVTYHLGQAGLLLSLTVPA